LQILKTSKKHPGSKIFDMVFEKQGYWNR